MKVLSSKYHVLSKIRMRLLNKTKDSIKLIPLLAVALFFLLASFGTSFALGGNVSGFAWGAVDSDNSGVYTPGVDGGAGWISFSHSLDFPTSPDNFYQVNLDASTGDFSGYAWSSNIGWINFDAGCPDGVTGACSAKVTNFQNGTIAGWARACGAFQSGCSGALNSNAGSWDGWIEMSGVNHPTGFFDNNGSPIPSTSRGVTFDIVTGQFSGYAWGGNSLDGHNDIGWISFGAGPDPVVTGGGGGCTPGQNCTPCDINPGSCATPIVTLISSTSSITPGQSIGLTWNTTNVNSCIVSTEILVTDTGFVLNTSNTTWIGAVIPPTQAQLITDSTTPFIVVPSGVSAGHTIRYRLTCTGNYTASSDTLIAVLEGENPADVPVIIYANGANPSTTVDVGDPVNLSWTVISLDGSEITTVPYNSCVVTADEPVSGTGWVSNQFVINDPQEALLGGLNSTSLVTLLNSSTVTFTIDCDGGVATDSVTVTQLQLTAYVNFGQAIIHPANGGGYNPGTIDLPWLGSNIDTSSCVLSWTATNGQSGQIQNAASPELAVPLYISGPPSSMQTTYTISCTPINNATPMNPDPLIQGNTKDDMTITPHTPPGGGPGDPPPIFEEF